MSINTEHTWGDIKKSDGVYGQAIKDTRQTLLYRTNRQSK